LFLTAAALDAVLAEIRSRARCSSATRIVLDCSGVPELPPRLMTEIAVLRRDLRQEGAELVLADCDPSLRRQLACSEFANLLGEPSRRHGAHPHQAPHAAFLRAFRRA
jgi:anti-anti-sigma regulatory factor